MPMSSSIAAAAAAVLLASPHQFFDGYTSSSFHANALSIVQPHVTKHRSCPVPVSTQRMKTSLHLHDGRVDTALSLTATATAFETAPSGAVTAANTNTDSYDFMAPSFDMDHVASALLESTPRINNHDGDGASSSLNLNAAAADYWPTEAENNDNWLNEAVVVSSEHQQHQQEAPSSSIRRSSSSSHNRPSSSIRSRSVVTTGRERRAGFESYAPARGTPSRQGVTDGVVGSPGGAADWYYTSGYGPATTSATAVSSSSSSSVSTRRSGTKQAANVSKNVGQLANRRNVITGRERRSSFDSFNSFEPAHEPPRSSSRKGITSGSPTPSSSSNTAVLRDGAEHKNDAAKVAATLSSLHTRNYNDDAPSTPTGEEEESNHDDDLVEEVTMVPMDTPARQSLPSHLSLHSIPGKGLGIITNKPISKGELIGNYGGELMSEEVKDRRYLSSLQDTLTPEDRGWIQSRLDRGQTLTGCYLYGVSLPDPDDQDNYGRFAKQQKQQQTKDDKPSSNNTPKNRIYIDAEDEYHGTWTRFLNHASPPYNNVNPKSVPESYDGEPRVWFMANRDIDVGEELCFDYGEDYWLEGDDVVG